MTETVNDLVEIVYLSQEKFEEMKSNSLLDPNTIYVTDSNLTESFNELVAKVNELENAVQNLQALITDVSSTVDNINGEVI